MYSYTINARVHDCETRLTCCLLVFSRCFCPLTIFSVLFCSIGSSVRLSEDEEGG